MANPAAAREQAEKVFRAILDYEPNEVCKDEFAYDRMVENYRDAARKGIALLAAEPSAPMSDEDECPCCLTHSCEAFRGYIASTLRPAPPAAPAPDAVESIIVLTPAHGVAPITITRSAGGLHTGALPAPENGDEK